MTKEDYYSCFNRSNASQLIMETCRRLDCLTAMQWATEERLYGENYSNEAEREKLEKLLGILDHTLDALEKVNDLA